MEFSNRLRQLRNASGISIRKLAKKIGVSPTALSSWESHNVNDIKAIYLFDLADFFKVDAYWLLTGKGSKKPSKSILGMSDSATRYLHDLSLDAKKVIESNIESMYLAENWEQKRPKINDLARIAKKLDMTEEEVAEAVANAGPIELSNDTDEDNDDGQLLAG